MSSRKVTLYQSTPPLLWYQVFKIFEEQHRMFCLFYHLSIYINTFTKRLNCFNQGKKKNLTLKKKHSKMSKNFMNLVHKSAKKNLENPRNEVYTFKMPPGRTHSECRKPICACCWQKENYYELNMDPLNRFRLHLF